MAKFVKFSVAAAAAVLAAGSLTACSTVESIDMTTVKSVIDVRTAGEYSTGHLEGSLNIDIQGPFFESGMAQLDHAANYVIYCHSGNRAGQAITYMKSHDFTGTLTNAGSVDDASSATGLKVVQ